MILVLVVALCGSASGASAAASVRLAATINGRDAARSSEQHPLRLNLDRPATLDLQITNVGTSPVSVRTVRLEGRVMGLTFFAYDTSVGIGVDPGATVKLAFPLDLAGLGGQATGLIPGSVKLLDDHRHQIASQSLVSDVRGSLLSVYGVFGLTVTILTVVALLTALVALARHQLPPNRWRRGLRFLPPGIGVGLFLVFTLSATRVFAAQAGRWMPMVGISSAALFVFGYLTPSPEELGPTAGPGEDWEIPAGTRLGLP